MIELLAGVGIGWGLAHMDAARWAWLGTQANTFAAWIVAKATGGKNG